MHHIIEMFPDQNIKWLQIAGSIVQGFRFTESSIIQHKQRIKTYYHLYTLMVPKHG